MQDKNKQDDERWMKRAADLAERGIGFVNPNPLVGAVLVKSDTIIGEGWHKKYGEAHAERNAIADCMERCRINGTNAVKTLQGATLYVTLEPCCHHGKTPPCTEAIIEHKIGRVVIAAVDPNPQVGGKGITQLRQAGITVDTGVLEERCQHQNEVFFHYIKTGLPYVVMKYAMTADGKIATKTGDSKWVTGEEARIDVHEQRRKLSAIMVGINTVLCDDPMLNCRLQPEMQEGIRQQEVRNPIRIICDSHLKLPLDSRLVKTAAEISTIVACCEGKAANDKKEKMAEKGIEILELPQNIKTGSGVDLKLLMKQLGKRGIDSILLEGGGELNFSALERGIVSRIMVYIAPKFFGGRSAKSPVEGEGIALAADAELWRLDSVSRFGEDILLDYRREEKFCLQELSRK